jgi:hypothetical protein
MLIRLTVALHPCHLDSLQPCNRDSLGQGIGHRLEGATAITVVGAYYSLDTGAVAFTKEKKD